jgi:hypothetical protein
MDADLFLRTVPIHGWFVRVVSGGRPGDEKCFGKIHAPWRLGLFVVVVAGAGFEPCVVRFFKALMARDFWSKGLNRWQFASQFVCSLVRAPTQVAWSLFRCTEIAGRVRCRRSRSTGFAVQRRARLGTDRRAWQPNARFVPAGKLSTLLRSIIAVPAAPRILPPPAIYRIDREDNRDENDNEQKRRPPSALLSALRINPRRNAIRPQCASQTHVGIHGEIIS